MPFYIKLVGAERLLKKLDLLERVTRRQIVREACRAGANVILPAVKSETNRFQYKPSNPLPAGRRRGDLLRGLKVRAIKRTRTAIGVTLVSTLKENARIKDLYYGAFVNWGHKIGRRPGKGKTDTRKGKVKPVPYMTAGFHRAKRRASAVTTHLIKVGIEREWKKMWGK